MSWITSGFDIFWLVFSSTGVPSSIRSIEPRSPRFCAVMCFSTSTLRGGWAFPLFRASILAFITVSAVSNAMFSSFAIFLASSSLLLHFVQSPVGSMSAILCLALCASYPRVMLLVGGCERLRTCSM